MAAHIDNSDNEPGRKERIATKYIPGMFENVQSIQDFATCISVPVKAIALVQPTGETCKSRATANGCSFPAINRNRGYCCVHSKVFYPLLNDKGSALMGLQYLRPPDDINHRGCDCDYKLCKQMGYFPSKQGAIKVPVSARDVVLRSPNLFSPTKKLNLQYNNKQIFLYPWHFYKEDLKCSDEGTYDGKWSLDYDKKEDKKYYDGDKFSYESPPPRQSPRNFINEEFSSFVRPQDKSWRERDSDGMPEWMWEMLRIDDNNAGNTHRTPKKLNHTQLLRQERMWRARAHHLESKISTTEQAHNTEMIGQKRKYEAIIAKKDELIKEQKEKIDELEEDVKQLRKELEKTQEELKKAREKKGRPLRYSDLFGDGILSKEVGSFTFFNTAELNDSFLNIINFADGSEGSLPEGDGMCENMRRYSLVTAEERDGTVPPPSMDPDSDEYRKKIEAVKERRGREDGITWKDEYLAFCIYVRAGTTQKFAATLCGISTTLMSNIYHAWGNLLCDSLVEMFPRPTRNEMLRAYPSRFYESNGDAKIEVLLDAFEVFTQSSSNKNVAASTHSDYKKHCTAKFLGACDTILVMTVRTRPLSLLQSVLGDASVF